MMKKMQSSNPYHIQIERFSRGSPNIDVCRNKLIITLLYFGTILKVNLIRVSRCPIRSHVRGNTKITNGEDTFLAQLLLILVYESTSNRRIDSVTL